MAARIIGAPYATGVRGVGLGRGPLELLGERDDVTWLGEPGDDVVEAGRVFALNAALAGLVSEARAGGATPIVVAGNCSTCTAQVGHADGIVWLDTHADFNTPDTTASGFLDGMALSFATGEGYDHLRAAIPGFRAVAPDRVVLVGVRDVDPLEQRRIDVRGVRSATAAAVEPPAERVYLHVDLDVLDTSVGRANQFARAGGLQVADVLGVIERVAARATITGAAITAWDPSYDDGGGIRDAAGTILAALEAAL